MRRFAFLALGLALGWGCGDEEEAPPPGYGNGGTAGDAGDSGSGGAGKGGSGGGGTAGSSEGGDAGSPEPTGGTSGTSGKGGAGGTSEPGGMGGDETGGTGTGGTGGPPPPCEDMNTGQPPTGVCNPAAMLGATMDVPLGDAAATFLAVTPDELTIAWFNSNVMGESFWVADRTAATDAFGTGQQLLHQNLTFSALSPDGLRLAALAGGGQSLVEVTRTARGGAFPTSSTAGSFSTLNSDAMSRGLTFAGCVIAPDDRTLYYLVIDGQSDQPLRISKRAGAGPWPVGDAIEGCEFQAHGDLLSQPTGVSEDGRTLFFYDVARAQSRAAWRRSADGPFEWFEDLGTVRGAQPNLGCNRLYFTSASGPSFASLD